MTLLLELVGALVLAAMIRGLLPGRVSLLSGLTVVAVALAGFAFWSNVWSVGRGFISQHAVDARLTAEQALAVPGGEYGAREDVLAWADGVLPRQARVFLDCQQPNPCQNALANWITYRLLPRVFTDFPWQAQWVLFYDTPPGALESVKVSDEVVYKPGFAIARLTR